MKRCQLQTGLVILLIVGATSYAGEKKNKENQKLPILTQTPINSPTSPTSPTIVHLRDSHGFAGYGTKYTHRPEATASQLREERSLERSLSGGNLTPRIIYPLRSLTSPQSDPGLFSKEENPKQLLVDCGNLKKARLELSESRTRFSLPPSSRPSSPLLTSESQNELTFFIAGNIVQELLCMLHAINTESRAVNAGMVRGKMPYYMSLHEKAQQELDALRAPFLPGTLPEQEVLDQKFTKGIQNSVRKLICRNQEQESLLLRNNRDAERCRKETLLNNDIRKAELAALRIEVERYKPRVASPVGPQLRERQTSVTSPTCQNYMPASSSSYYSSSSSSSSMASEAFSGSLLSPLQTIEFAEL